LTCSKKGKKDNETHTFIFLKDRGKNKMKTLFPLTAFSTRIYPFQLEAQTKGTYVVRKDQLGVSPELFSG
jgi:hypothetical protein